MKSPRSQAIWLVITCAAYLVGSFWGGRSLRHGATSGSVALDAEGSVSETLPHESEANKAQTLSSRDEVEQEPLRDEAIEALAKASTKSQNPIERQLAFAQILEAMASDSFDVAQAMAMRSALFENGASREQWRLFNYAWAAKDPKAAIAYLDEVPEELRARFLGSMLPGLASTNPETAIGVFEGLEPEEQSQLRSRLYEGLIDHDPELATGYVYDSADPEKPDWRPMDTLARELVDDLGLEETLDWATDLPEGSLRANAWSAAYAKWASEDPHAAVASIAEMPVSADRNQAINGFISALAGEDPEAAVTWAAEISEPHLREGALVRAGSRFFLQDEGAAQAWFQSSGLPEDTLGKMLPK